MTDGENTQNRWTSSTTSIDARTQKARDNVKAANIKLNTVRVTNSDVTLLKGCATKSSMYQAIDVLRRAPRRPAQQRVQLDRAEPCKRPHQPLTRGAPRACGTRDAWLPGC